MDFLKYKDETDKSYGITGMVISMKIWDDFSMLRSITLDNGPEEDAVSFNPEFFFNGNPRFSAKITWNETLRQFQLLAGMMMGNLLCRTMVHQHKRLSRSNLSDIYAIIEEEGRNNCELERDEVETIFNKIYNHLSSIYANRQMAELADRFADVVRTRRTMTGNEVEEQLELLRRY